MLHVLTAKGRAMVCLYASGYNDTSSNGVQKLRQIGTVGHASSHWSALVQVRTLCNDTVSAVKGVKEPLSGSVMESFQPFIHDDFVLLAHEFKNSAPITVWRHASTYQALTWVDRCSLSMIHCIWKQIYPSKVYILITSCLFCSHIFCSDWCPNL